MSSEASLAVRKRIRETYDKLSRATGIVEIDRLAEQLTPAGVAGQRPQLLMTLATSPPLVVFNGQWVALIGTKQESVLTRRLRQMLAVRNRLSLPTVLAQLIRANAAYQHMPEEILRAFITAHHDFRIVDDRIESPVRLQPKTELDDPERFILGVLMFGPKTKSEIIADTRRPRKVSNVQVLDALKTSVVFAVAIDGRFMVVKDSPATMALHSRLEEELELVTEPEPSTISFPTQLSLGETNAVASTKQPASGPRSRNAAVRSAVPSRAVLTRADDDLTGSVQLSLGLGFEA